MVPLRRRLVLGVGTTALVTGAVTGAAGLSALSAAEDLQQAQGVLAAVRDGQASTERSLAALRRARGDVASAERDLGRWPVDVVAAVPLLGRSWDAERAVARTASEVIAGALALADGVSAVRARSGGVDLQALARTRQQVAGPARRARAAMDELRDTPVGLTPRPVGQGVRDARRALQPAVSTLGRASTGLGLADGLLGGSGPRSVLVVLQNNAELRGAGGYVSTFGTGRLQDGRLALEPLRDVLAVADPPERARRVPAPAEYVEDYGYLSGDTTVWRLWNLSPHVPDSAAVGSSIAGALLGQAPDVVVMLDVPAMGALASLGGTDVLLPDGSRVGAGELTEALLVDAYEQAGTDSEDQVRRRDELRAAATAAVGRLLAGDLPAVELMRTLEQLAAGRHLSMWSARPGEQEALVDLGLAGAVATPPGGDLSHVSVNNIGGNKLDVYVDRTLSVDVRLGRQQASVVQRVRFANRAPDGLVPYVTGTDRPGTVTSLVEMSLPTGAASVTATLDGQPVVAAPRRGQLRQRLSTRLELPQGASGVLEVRYVLPVRDGTYRLRLLPQPLAEDAALSLSVRPVDGERVAEVEGARAQQGAVVEQAAFSRTREVRVRLRGEQDLSTWERVKRFWNSPVTLG